MIRRVASTPSITGMSRSISTTSGVSAALGHRLGTVAGDPDDLVLRLEGQRAAQRLDGQRHVIDDSDPQPCASPIRTTTASSKASS